MCFHESIFSDEYVRKETSNEHLVTELNRLYLK